MREKQINEFLERWDEMLAAANAIDGFKWEFKVSITSDVAILDDRIRTINGINESFSKNKMSWTSSNK